MRYKVLYVDDEKSNLRIFKDTFRRDFEILVANSAFEALELLNDILVDVVITDQRMPDMTGVELLAEIDEQFDDIPPHRLIVSGYAKDGDIELAFKKYKLSKFVSKPWSYEELKEVIINSIQE